jgi:hypothetical protein
VKLDEVHERELSRFMHAPSDPRGEGFVYQADLRRLVFRIADPDLNRKSEEWWAFKLPEAKEEFRKRPREGIPASSAADRVIASSGGLRDAFTLVRVADLRLARMGLHYTLLDPQTRSGLERFEAGGAAGWSEDADHAFLSASYRHGTLLDESGPKRFAIGLPKSGKRSSIAIEGDPAKPAVREIGREPWSVPTVSKPAQRYADLPVARLVSRGDFPIPVGSKEGSPIRDIEAFRRLDGRGPSVRPQGEGPRVHAAASRRPGARPRRAEDHTSRFLHGRSGPVLGDRPADLARDAVTVREGGHVHRVATRRGRE